MKDSLRSLFANNIFSKQEVLEKIKKDLASNAKNYQIISLNPEIVELTRQNESFNKIVRTAQIKILDGIGVYWGLKVLGMPVKQRTAGVDLMDSVITMASEYSLAVLLIGGKAKVAERLAECYTVKYPHLRIKGIQGVVDMDSASRQHEEAKVFAIVSAYMPQIVFVAYGSPKQEIWINNNLERFNNAICMGVGGSFDYLVGDIKRAPAFLRTIGLEWLFRLYTEPWRWKRQLRIITFIKLLVQESVSSRRK